MQITTMLMQKCLMLKTLRRNLKHLVYKRIVFSINCQILLNLINVSIYLLSVPVGYSSLGPPTEFCRKYGAVMWKEERTNKNVKTGVPKFSLGCSQGQIKLPPTPSTPSYLNKLYNDPKKSHHFKRSIRLYNSMFAFTSMGGKVDHAINSGKAPYVYRLNGQNHHVFGTLIPDEGDDPKFCQLYVYDTENEVQNRVRWVKVEQCVFKIVLPLSH